MGWAGIDVEPASVDRDWAASNKEKKHEANLELRPGNPRIRKRTPDEKQRDRKTSKTSESLRFRIDSSREPSIPVFPSPRVNELENRTNSDGCLCAASANDRVLLYVSSLDEERTEELRSG
jgi:hypothetical protein